MLVALAVLALPGTQLAGAHQPQGPPISTDGAKVQAEFEAGLRLGARAASVRARLAVAPMVVIVSDPRTYLAVLEQWSIERRFPVLIDDGTMGARDDIARFVRAFEPERVVLHPPAGIVDRPLPDAAERVIRSAWNGDDDTTTREAWNTVGLTPMGIVVASDDDPAWTAAIALAAGRGQPIAWVGAIGTSLNGSLREASIDQLRTAATRAADAHELAWQGLGDDVDAVTLCLTLPSGTGGGPLALTDVLPRHESGDRWAFAGLIAGSEAEAAYDAMCALFLRAERAWMFDGYPASFAAPYQLGGVESVFDQLKIDAQVFPSSSADRWRALTRRGVDAGLIHVNTRGQSTWFDLEPGRLTSDELPMLRRPAAVHFIHSFSARSMGDRRTLGRRWLDAGAFSYTGSVHEPLLSAFVPAEVLVRRLGGGMPIGAAMRIDGAGAWKINLFGDPLWMLVGPHPGRAEVDARLDGVPSADAVFADALRGQDFARAARLLVMLGRDDDVTQLVTAIDVDENTVVSPELAVEAFGAAVRTGRGELAASLFERMPPDSQREPGVAAMLWTALADEFRPGGDATMLALMSAHVPDADLPMNAKRLEPHLRRALGGAAVRAMYERLIEQTESEGLRARLRRAAGINEP
ncbi:MAG: hypothetical protein AAGI30_00955 [Planctomycetota bacterium]